MEVHDSSIDPLAKLNGNNVQQLTSSGHLPTSPTQTVAIGNGSASNVLKVQQLPNGIKSTTSMITAQQPIGVISQALSGNGNGLGMSNANLVNYPQNSMLTNAGMNSSVAMGGLAPHPMGNTNGMMMPQDAGPPMIDTSMINGNGMMSGHLTPGALHSPMTPNTMDSTEANKMFIGGLSWNTNEVMLFQHFQQFGDIAEHCVMRDAQTGRSRGFGFVKFGDPTAVDRVLAHPTQHVIDEKAVDPKRAVPKYQSKMINKTKKVFLGGLPSDTNNEDVQAHFSQFGEVEEVMLMYDRTTHRLRGFGFVKFAQEDAAEAACREHYHEIKGKMVEAKKAQPKEVMTNMQLRKWSYGLTGTATPGDPSSGLQYFLNSTSAAPTAIPSRNPMFAPSPYQTSNFPNFPYSPVMGNYPGSPTFPVSSPLAAAMAAEQRGGTPNHFVFSDLIPSPFNGTIPTRTTMSPSPLDTFSRDSFLSGLGPPFMNPGSPRGNITSPPLPTYDPYPDIGVLATSPQQNSGFQYGSPYGSVFGNVPPAMVAAYKGGLNQ